MQIEILQQAFADSLTSSGFKKDIVRKYHSSTSSGFEHKHHVLEEVQLVILGLDIEIWAVDVHRTSRASTERRIGKYYIHKRRRLFFQRILTHNRTAVCANAMQIKIHGSKCYDQRRIVHTMQSFVTQKITFFFTCRLHFHIIVSSKQETACTTSWVANGFAHLRIDAIHHCLNQWARCEILSGTAFLILSVLFKNAFVDSTFHITVHDEPLLFINHGDNLFQINRLVYLILRLRINRSYQIILLTKQFKSFFILLHQIQTIKSNQIIPLIACRDSRFLSEHFYILCIHLQE